MDSVRRFLALAYVPIRGLSERVERGTTYVGVALLLGAGIWRSWSWIGLFALIAVAFGVAGVKLQRQLDNQQLPLLKLERIKAGFAPLVRQEMLADPSGAQIAEQIRHLNPPFIVRPTITNSPDGHRHEARVVDAFVKVKLYEQSDAEEKLVWETDDGRWADNPAALSVGPYGAREVMRRRDLPPSGESHEIEVAMKLSGESGFLPVDNGLLRQAQQDRPRFGPGQYRVEFAVHATGLADPPSWSFTIVNPPNTSKLEVSQP